MIERLTKDRRKTASGVLAALKDYHKRRGRKQGYHRPTKPRKRTQGEAGAILGRL